MGWKKMIFGEKMPDRNDPKYRQRYENEVNAGRRFARMTRIDRVAGWVQHFAIGHTRLFLAVVFGFVFLNFGYNIYRMATAYGYQKDHRTATQQQEEVLRRRHDRISHAVSSSHSISAEASDEFQKYNKLNEEDNGNEGSLEKD